MTKADQGEKDKMDKERLQDEEDILRRVTRVEAELRELATRVDLMDRRRRRRGA